MARKKKQTTKSTRDSVTLDSVFTGIAEAIRAKNGSSDPIFPRNMGNAIRGIKGVTEASLPEANLSAVFQDIADAIRACGITGTMTASQMAGKIGDIVVDQYHSDTWYKYANDTQWRTVSITGDISSSSIPDGTNVVAIEIGNTVTSIGLGAFSNCSGLTSVTIPNSVTEIYNNAFTYCHNLNNIIIPSNCIVKYNTFRCCSSMSTITFDNRTMTQVQSMNFYPFGLDLYKKNGNYVTITNIICSDGTIQLNRTYDKEPELL